MSIQKVNRKNKGVGYRVRVRDLNGNNRGRIFRTRKEAEVFESKIITSKATGIDVFPQDGKKVLSDVFSEWFKQFQNHSPKFIVELDSLWSVHILPYFGNRKIGSINSSEIRNWLLSAEVQSLSPDRRNRALKNVLVRVLDFAVDMGYISKNIARGSNGRVINSGLKTQKRSRLKRVLTFLELGLVAKNCGLYQVLILIMGLLGPRWAEAIGLKVCDINIEAGTITIQRSLTQVRGKFIEKSTKSGFSRTLDLPNFLKPMLSQHLIGKNQDDLVFTGTNGGPIDISNF